MAADAGVIDLLGMLAYGELLAFDRMAADARLAPDLRRQALLAQMAAAEIGNYRRLADRLTALGVDPQDAMAPFTAALRTYHDNTEPADWPEALTKAYVGDGISDDFFREVARLVPTIALGDADRALVLDVLHHDDYAAFAAREIRACIAVEPGLADRLSMWARRLVGEALSQAQQVAQERATLTALLLDGAAGEAAEGLFRRLTSAHTARMTAVGLNN
ncbi:ferritin-like fold-containing protein [Catellatospora tritici]|uniref:ferritin-like fold-containing protein n=1 Tax=Catellatospora tritici TaxID=2851566 RepID=UPI0027E16F25|nr:ferritin-like fold-containing protein [Catellatospora tritici]